MGHKVDDTLRDDNRRELAFPTGRDVEKVLPDHFKTEYPKFVSFLKEYFHFEDSDGSPSRLVNDLFYARDIIFSDAVDFFRLLIIKYYT